MIIHGHLWTFAIAESFHDSAKIKASLSLLSLLQDFMLENPSVKDASKSFKSFNPCFLYQFFFINLQVPQARKIRLIRSIRR